MSIDWQKKTTTPLATDITHSSPENETLSLLLPSFLFRCAAALTRSPANHIARLPLTPPSSPPYHTIHPPNPLPLSPSISNSGWAFSCLFLTTHHHSPPPSAALDHLVAKRLDISDPISAPPCNTRIWPASAFALQPSLVQQSYFLDEPGEPPQPQPRPPPPPKTSAPHIGSSTSPFTNTHRITLPPELKANSNQLL